METDKQDEIKLLAQVLISLIAIVGGIYILIKIPDGQAIGGGMIGAVIGYWLR